MTDNELLEHAAKAANYEIRKVAGYIEKHSCESGIWDWWNPLIDDGDALRLAVKLRLPLYFPVTRSEVVFCDLAEERYNSFGDPFAATRRAIVRSAASLVETETLTTKGA